MNKKKITRITLNIIYVVEQACDQLEHKHIVGNDRLVAKRPVVRPVGGSSISTSV